jgi:HIRAN domain
MHSMMKSRFLGISAGPSGVVVLLFFSLGCWIPGVAIAQHARLLIQDSPLAGFRFHAAHRVWEELAVGDRLELVREPDNPFDRNAIRIEWHGEKLGYVPRKENATLAWALDRGDPIRARISSLVIHPNPRERIRFEVFVD